MSSSSMDQLLSMKFQKIKEQKLLSDRMHDLLSKPGGLNESTKMSMKSLQAAIAVAKQPGYFEYYGKLKDVYFSNLNYNSYKW